jgi:N-glycosidase YbiA
MNHIFYSSRYEIPYGVFSNFALTPIIIATKEYPTVEHWYQSNKATNANDHEYIRHTRTPEEAKALGKRHQITREWMNIRIGIMLRGMLAKFKQHPTLGELLQATGDSAIHEDCNDPFWGWNNGSGDDWSGALLMACRYQLCTGLGHLPDGKVKSKLAGSLASGFQAAAGIRESRDKHGAWFCHIIQDSNIHAPSRILRDILSAGELRPTSGPGHENAVCFSTAPLSTAFERCFGIEKELRLQEGALTRSGYGIAIPYWLGRELGLQPALPMSRIDANALPQNQRFRIQFYSENDMYDWTHEEEWRSSSAITLLQANTIVLVPNQMTLAEMEPALKTSWHVNSLEALAGLR